MSVYLIENRAYEQFLLPPNIGEYGYAPGIEVTLRLPASGRLISGVHALLDTGCCDTWIYPHKVPIEMDEVEFLPKSEQIVVYIEIGDLKYPLPCIYREHPCVEANQPFSGTEDMLIGLDLMHNWLVELHGRKCQLTVSHLDPDLL